MQNKTLHVVLFELFVGLLGSLNCRENRFKSEKKKKKKKKHSQENLTKL